MNLGADPPGGKDTWLLVLEWARRQWPWLALGGVISVVVLVLLFRSSPESPERPPTGALGSPGSTEQGLDRHPVEGSPSRSAAASADAGVAPRSGGAAGDAGPPSPNVRIIVKTYPPRRASVTWGNKRLGFADRGKPLEIERPRDSGPLDLVIRAPGFVPVHTRAYTFDDVVVDVKITPLDKKDTLYGYRQPLPPEDAGAPE